MASRDEDVERAVSVQMYETAEKYEAYLSLTRPTLIQPLKSSRDYVRRRSMQTAPVGFVVRPSK